LGTSIAAPLTSVIIIFLDAEKFIEEAIESVLSQSATDWELVLVDDGSADSSSDIARGYAQRHPGRIRYLEHAGHQNRGMSASRNLGIENARGDFVAFLDADDVWMPERLERHLRVMREHQDVGMVYGPTLYWYSWSDQPGLPDAPPDHAGNLSVAPGQPLPPPAALLSFLESGGGSLPGICSVLARREAVQRVGGFEETFRGLYEDQVFLSKMCFHTTVYVVDEVLDKYRQHSDSHCFQAILKGDYHPIKPNPARERFLHWLESYLQENDAEDGRLLAALRRELWPYRHSGILTLGGHVLRYLPFLQYGKIIARRCLPPETYTWLKRQLRRQLAAGRRS